MLVESTDLATVGDLARIFDVVPSAVCNWEKRHKDFPAPLFTLGGTRVYSRSAVTKWAWGV